jgi:hypothetical protein
VSIERRTFLGATLLGAGSLTLGGSLWRSTAGPMTATTAAVGPYGPLLPADGNGVRLPEGFSVLSTTSAYLMAYVGSVHRWGLGLPSSFGKEKS